MDGPDAYESRVKARQFRGGGFIRWGGGRGAVRKVREGPTRFKFHAWCRWTAAGDVSAERNLAAVVRVALDAASNDGSSFFPFLFFFGVYEQWDLVAWTRNCDFNVEIDTLHGHWISIGFKSLSVFEDCWAHWQYFWKKNRLQKTYIYIYISQLLIAGEK